MMAPLTAYRPGVMAARALNATIDHNTAGTAGVRAPRANDRTLCEIAADREDDRRWTAALRRYCAAPVDVAVAPWPPLTAAETRRKRFQDAFLKLFGAR